MDLKKALSNLQKDRYVSSMLREELETLVAAVEASKGPDVALSKVEEKLSEALALLKGERAPANSKSPPKDRSKNSPKGRPADRGGLVEKAAVAAKA
ncbi:hypothetical protein D3C87_830390 [compost metagenome]